MKCLHCQKENPVICEIVKCGVSYCRKEIEIPTIDNEEINYAVLCPDHQTRVKELEKEIDESEQLVMRITVRINNWKDLIEARLKR